MANSLRVGDHLLERLAWRRRRMSLPVRRADRDRVRRPARGRRRGRRRAPLVHGRRPRGARRLRGRRDVHVGPRAGARSRGRTGSQDGSYEFDGRSHQLPLTEPEHATRSTASSAGPPGRSPSATPDRVVMEHTLHPQPGYPFSLALEHRVRAVRRRPAGAHDGDQHRRDRVPVRERRAPVPDARHRDRRPGRAARARRARCCDADERGIPTGIGARRRAPSTTSAQPRPIGATKLDNAFTDLERDEDGLARVELRDPDGGAALTLWVDESYRYLMLFTGDPLPDVAPPQPRGRADDLPAERFPDAARALIVLEPGESVTGAGASRPGEGARRMNSGQPHRVLILGGGFAGVGAAK